MFLKDPTYISSFFSISLNEVHYDLKKFVMISGFPISCSHSIHTSGWVSSVISSSLEILPHELSLFIHFFQQSTWHLLWPWQPLLYSSSLSLSTYTTPRKTEGSHLPYSRLHVVYKHASAKDQRNLGKNERK